MKYRNLLIIVYCIFMGTLLVSADCVGDGNQNAGKSKIVPSLPSSHHGVPDYSQKQMDIRSHILATFPGTYLDSMNITIKLLSDSIRNEISKTKDSAVYFKTCLNNVLQDSVLLDRVSKLLSESEHGKLDLYRTIKIHCVDISNSSAVDSVKMDLFSGSKLIASAISDKYGTIEIRNIPEGYYDIFFSRRGYVGASLKHFKYSGEEQSSVDIPLSRQNSFLIQVVCKNIWLIIAAGGFLVLLSLVSLIYALTRRKSKKAKTT